MYQSKKISKYIVLFCILSCLAVSDIFAEHFNFTKPVTDTSMNFVGDLFKIDEVAAEVGDEIAVYDPRGTMCGHFILESIDPDAPDGYFTFPVFGDDSSTPSVRECAAVNETLDFVVWDASAAVEIPLENSMYVKRTLDYGFYVVPEIQTIPPQFLGANGMAGMGILATTPLPEPTIDSVSSEIFTSGGGILQITGTNFDTAEAVVTIDGITITESRVNSPTSITCVYPKHEAGNATLVVVNPENMTASYLLTYEYDPPEINDVTPSTVSTEGGITITITGDYFRENAAVIIAGITANVLRPITDTMIQCIAPTYSFDEPVSLTVINDDTKSAIFENAYTYVFVPKIETIFPEEVLTTGGGILQITGSYFDYSATVQIGDSIPDDITVVSDSLIECSIPANDEGGIVKIIVTNPDGYSAVDNITYNLPNPTITSLFPTSVYTSGGQTLMITGTNFDSDLTTIMIDGKSPLTKTVTDTLIICTVPPNDPGIVDILVTNPGNLTASTTVIYDFEFDEPAITEISPEKGTIEGDEALVIIGTNFQEGAVVYVGGITAVNITVVNDSTITFFAPEVQETGIVDVTILNPDTQSFTLINAFEYIILPEIEDVFPTMGLTSGGTSITITGKYFFEGLTVNIAGQAISPTQVTENTIRFQTPEKGPELTDITVTNPDGYSDTLSDAFEFKAVIAKFDILSETSGSAPFIGIFEDKSQGDIEEWQWFYDEDEDPKVRYESDTVYIAYTAPGVYPITLLVISPDGEEDTAVDSITVESYDVKVDFYTPDETEGAAPMTVEFINDTKNAEALDVTWTWNFGDGYTMTVADSEESITHAYMETGSYTVTLTADIEGYSPISEIKKNYIQVVERLLTGQIVDEDGQGIGGCQVSLILPGDIELQKITADPQGYYTFDKLPPEEFLHLKVEPPELSDYFPAVTHEPLSTLTDDTEGLALTLYAGVLVGKITQTSGEGIAGVEIALLDSSDDDAEVSRCRTTVAGEYTLTGIPEGTDYILSAWFDKTGTELFYSVEGPTSDNSEASSISITDAHRKGSPQKIDMTLEGNATISGRITYENGAVAADIFVSAWSEGLMMGGNATTNEYGLYTITGLTESDGISENRYIVAIDPEDFPYQAYNGKNKEEDADLVSAPDSGINFVIKSGLTITGTVTVDSGSKKNIEVTARSKKAQFEHSAMTDSEGQYTLTGLKPANDYIVFAHAPDYPVVFYDNRTSAEEADYVDLSFEDATVDFNMEKGYCITGEISGLGYDPALNTIWVNVWSSKTATGGHVPTDASGRYEVVGLDAAADDYIIYIMDPEFGQAYYKEGAVNSTVYKYTDLLDENNVVQGVTASPISESDDRNLQLPSELYSVKGKITYEDKPIPGIQIEAWSESQSHWKTCFSASRLNSDGANYELTGLVAGEYVIEIISEKYILENEPVSLSVTGNRTGFDLILGKPGRKITGSVSNLEAGSIVWISTYSESLEYGDEVKVTGTSDAKDDYTISGLKPASDYIVQLHSADFPDIVYDGKTKISEAKRVDLKDDDKSKVDFTLTLQTELGKIAGIITVPQNAAQGEEIWVDAFSDTVDSSNSVMVLVSANCTDAGGCQYPYTITGLISSDDYLVMVNSEEYETLFYDGKTRLKNLTLVNTNESKSIDFTLKKGNSITGTITDQDGAVADIEVEAWSESTYSWGFDKTDANGQYEIKGLSAASDYVVQALIEDEPPFVYSNTRDIDFATPVSNGQTGIDIKIETGYTISGYVLNTSGKGLKNVVVAAESQTQNLESHDRTDDSGKYEIKGLPGNSTYLLSAETVGTQSYKSQESSIKIDDSSMEVNFTLETGYEVSGTVKNSSNEPVVNADIFLRSDETGFDRWTETNSDGEYAFNGVPAGNDYGMMVETDEAYINKTVSLVVTTNMNQDISLDTAAGSIKGTVKNSDGNALATVSIHIYSYSQVNYQRFDVITNYKGEYEINGLESANDYVITAVPDTYTEYAEESVSNKSPGDTVNFELSSGGSIYGVVQTATGTKLEGVLLSLESASLNVNNEVTRTDTNGKYEFSGLKNNSASDYIVTVYPSDYPITERTGLNISETESVDFYLTSGAQTTISGTLRGTTIASKTTKVKVYNASTYRIEGEAFVSEYGSYEINSLKADTNYVLHFLKKDGSLNHYVCAGYELNPIYDGTTTFSTGNVVDVTVP